MASKFWNNFAKAGAITATAVGGVAALGGVASKLIKTNVERKKQKVEMQIDLQDAQLRQQKALLDQEIKLRELELKKHSIDSNANKDITLSQINANRDISMQNMKTQASMQNTYVTSAADVQKAQAMYNENSALAKNAGMIYDQSNGVAMDSRNVNYMNYNNGMMYPGNMGMMQMGAMYPMNNACYNQNGMNMNQVQQRILEAKNMYDQGLIDEKEYDKLKNNILSGNFNGRK